MMWNPVFSREMKVNSGSTRLPAITLLFSGILPLVILLNMYFAVAQVRTTAAIQYSSFMDMYEFVTIIEFIPLMFIVPAATISSISGERECQTLELMLTTQMTAFQVVIGKLMSALGTLLFLIVSNFPAVAVVFVYGGITWGDAIFLSLCYITVAFFTGSVGPCSSALLKRSTISTVVTYGVLVAVVAGTYLINKFALSPPSVNINDSVVAYGFEENAVRTTSGGVFYLLLLSPTVTLPAIFNGQVGGSAPLTKIRSYSGMTTTNSITDNWIMASILIQLALVILVICTAVRCVESIKHGRKNGREGVNHGNY